LAIKYKNHNPDIIRVLYVNLESSIAGAEQSLLLFVHFAPKSLQISATCPDGILSRKLNNSDIQTQQILLPPRRFNLAIIWFLYLLLVNIQILLISFRARPQIIHANNSKAVLASVLSRVFICNILIWHMRDLRCSRLLAGICGYLSTKVVAISNAVKNKLIDIGVRYESIEVIYNGITPYDSEIKEKFQNDSFLFANIGQFVPWKKQFLFIDVAEKFLQENCNANFVLIGDDIFGRDSRYKKELINRVKKSSFKQNIEIISWQDNLESLWSKIDCLVHTADTEPFGRVIIEAMAHSIPVIAAAAGGPAEIITDHKTGLLFEPNDIEDLLGAMKKIYQDSEFARNLATNGREHVLSNFQASKTAERIAKVYKELLAA